MEKTKMTKKETINLLIDVLVGNKEVEDTQIFVDFLIHERELLERKAGVKAPTKNQVANEEFAKAILETLKAKEVAMTIKEIQGACDEVAELTNQRISALLKKLVDSNLVERVIEKKITSFRAIA